MIVLQKTVPLERNLSLSALCKQHHVRNLSVFGSAARGAMRPVSDVDLLIEFGPGRAPSLAGLAKMREALELTPGVTSVDLATPSIFRNPYQRQSIFQDLKSLYVA